MNRLEIFQKYKFAKYDNLDITIFHKRRVK